MLVSCLLNHYVDELTGGACLLLSFISVAVKLFATRCFGDIVDFFYMNWLCSLVVITLYNEDYPKSLPNMWIQPLWQSLMDKGVAKRSSYYLLID